MAETAERNFLLKTKTVWHNNNLFHGRKAPVAGKTKTRRQFPPWVAPLCRRLRVCRKVTFFLGLAKLLHLILFSIFVIQRTIVFWPCAWCCVPVPKLGRLDYGLSCLIIFVSVLTRRAPFSALFILFPFFMSVCLSCCQSGPDFLIRAPVTHTARLPVTYLIFSLWHPMELLFRASCSLSLQPHLFMCLGLTSATVCGAVNCPIHSYCWQSLSHRWPPRGLIRTGDNNLQTAIQGRE